MIIPETRFSLNQKSKYERLCFLIRKSKRTENQWFIAFFLDRFFKSFYSNKNIKIK